MSGRILKRFRRHSRVYVKEDRRVSIGFKDETVVHRFNDRKHLCADYRLARQIGKNPGGCSPNVGVLPFGYGSNEGVSPFEQVTRNYELLELVVGEVPMHRGFTFLEPLVRLRLEQRVPIRCRDVERGATFGQDGQQGIRFTEIGMNLDPWRVLGVGNSRLGERY